MPSRTCDDAEQQRVLGEVPPERVRSNPRRPEQLRGTKRVGGDDDGVGAHLLLAARTKVAQDGTDDAVALPYEPDA